MKNRDQLFHKYYRSLFVLCLYLCACLIFFMFFIKHQIDENMIRRISQVLKSHTGAIISLVHPKDIDTISAWSPALFSNLYEDSGHVYILHSDGSVHYAEPGMEHTIDLDFRLFLETDPPSFAHEFDQLLTDLSQNHASGMVVRYNNSRYYMCYAPLEGTGFHLVYLVPSSYALKEYSFIWRGALLYLSLLALGILIFIWTTMMDIRQENRTLAWKADRDSLTGLWNHRALEEGITHILDQSIPTSRHLFCLIDLDGFKKVNDTLGHDAGDNLLKEVASCLTESCRSSDIVGRSGGDEFVIFFKDAGSSPLPLNQVASLNQKIQNLPFLADTEVRIGCSIGLATYPLDGRDFLSLYKNSDHALYASKQNGKGMVTQFSDLKPEDKPSSASRPL